MPNSPVPVSTLIPSPTSAVVPPSLTSAVPPITEPPKKKSLLKPIIILLTLLFIVLIAVMFTIRNLSKSTTSPSPNPISGEGSDKTEDPTADWTLYINRALGFQIKTPKDWKAVINDNEPNIVWLKAPDESTIKITSEGSEEKTFSFEALPAPSQDYELIVSTFKKITMVDFSKWRLWTDPNKFTLKYPPNAKVKHVNENTIVEVKSDSGTFTVTFCKNCVKDTCIGTCDKEKDIRITVGNQKYAEKQVWPDNSGNFNFRVVIAYPNTYVREKLAIFGNYPYEENLDEIDNILSTFEFTEKKKDY